MTTTTQKLCTAKNALMTARECFMTLTERDIRIQMIGYLDVLEFEANQIYGRDNL